MSAKARTVCREFDVQAGRKQVGNRPAIMLSPTSFNVKAGRILCGPITTKVKDYPFEVALAGKTAVCSCQVRSLAWRMRKAKLKGKVLPEELETIRQPTRLPVG